MKKMVVNALLSGLLITAAGATPVLADNTDQPNRTLEATAAAGADSQIEQETPALIPGNFFYFIKTVVEQIQLALTFDDVDKALLLAEHAQERILEANALIAEGKTDLAAQTLQKALEDQQQALEQAKQTETLASNKDVLDAYIPAGAADAEAVDEQNIDEGQNADENHVKENDEDTDLDADQDEAADGDAEGAEEDDSEVKQQFSGMLKQNIASLILAMDKVKNPTAKAALAKNIEKSFGKMVTKSAKLAADKEADADDSLLEFPAAAKDTLTSEQAGVQSESTAAVTIAEQSAAAQTAAIAKEESKNGFTKQEKKAIEKADKQKEKAKTKAEKQNGKPEKPEKQNNGRHNGQNK